MKIGAFLVVLCLSLGLADCSVAARHAGGEVLELSEPWHYRWGDSPLDPDGVPTWVREDSSAEFWLTLPEASHGSRKQDSMIWLRTRLPAFSWNDPALVTYHIFGAFEVYQGERLVYRSGELTAEPTNKYEQTKAHFISLDPTAETNVLFFRLFFAQRRFIWAEQPIFLVSKATYVKEFVKRFAGRAILGVLLLVLGVFVLAVHGLRRKQESLPHLSFALLSISAGIFEILGSWLAVILIEAPVLSYYLWPAAALLFPVGLFRFLEQTIGAGPKKVLRRLWQIHLVGAAIGFLLEILNVVPLPIVMDHFTYLAALTVTVSLALIARAAWKGNTEAKILGAGYGLLGFTGLWDVGWQMGILPDLGGVFHYGLFAFVISLAFIVERRYSDALRSLEDYSHNLEEKVALRTEDLKNKNEELEETLRQLEAAQDQLILSEKMASLGNLAAGVAHEVNNPIGAMNAAADVSERCVKKINESLEENQTPPRGKLQKTLEILKDNVRVIKAAGGRVSKIVQSLKNFAALDQAELQRTDIHQDLDNTLVLLEHQLKDRVEVVKDYGEIPPVECYRSQLNQVFMGLLRFASNAIEEAGTMTLRTRSVNDAVEIELTDTGRGMPPEEVNQLFDFSFSRRGSRVAANAGLSIVRDIIERHGGTIKVRSEVGQGTTVTVKLPLGSARNSPPFSMNKRG